MVSKIPYHENSVVEAPDQSGWLLALSEVAYCHSGEWGLNGYDCYCLYSIWVFQFIFCIYAYSDNIITQLLQKTIAPTPIITRSSTSLNAFLTPEERADKISRWGEIRAMTNEEAAANLEGEELETYNNYYTEVRDGVLKMQELAQVMIKDVEKTDGIAPKTKGQRKRDKWAVSQARAAANAAAALNRS